MKKIRVYVFFAVLIYFIALAMPLFGACEQKGRVQQLIFGAGGTGGTFFPLAATMSVYLNSVFDDFNFTVQATGGSVDNARLIAKNSIDFGLNNLSEMYWAYNGKEMFDEPVKNIRAVAKVFTFTSQWITMADSGIETISDLKGKRLGIGPPGSGSAVMAEIVLEILGLKDEVRISRLEASDAVREMKDGNIDAISYMGHFPTAFVIEALTLGKIRMLDLGDELREVNFYEKYPIYAIITIPAGTYGGIDEDIETPGGITFWTAPEELSEEIVYKCVKAVFSEEGLKYLGDSIDVAKGFSIENNLINTVIPVHPGAARFFREQGETVPDIK